MATTTKKCKSCGAKLYKDARFCHSCGKQTEVESIACPQCRLANPPDAKFCLQCGYPINVVYTPSDKVTPLYRLDFDRLDTLTYQLRDAFAVFISMAVEADGEFEKEPLFLEAFHEKLAPTEFFGEQMNKLAAHLSSHYQEQGTQAFMLIELQVYVAFQCLLQRFWIEYVPQLLPFPLSPRILNYEKDSIATVPLRAMLLDYLQLDQEDLLLYTNAIEIPVKSLQNARQSFFFPQAGEVPYIFIDMTVLKSGKEGVILTNKALYWKSYFHKPSSVAYHSINSLKRFKNHLEINDVYFNVTPSLNYKLLKLLQHLKRLLDIKTI